MSYSWLPPLLNEIADVAGPDAALQLADARGGSRIYIPAKLGKSHWLIDVIGRDAAVLLVDHYRSGVSGAYLDLPVGPASGANATRRKVDRLLRDGVSADRIAHSLRVHRTTVFRRKASLRPDDNYPPNQPDLFD